MITTDFATLPHPFKSIGNKAPDRQRGRNHPPLSRVVLPTTAIRLTMVQITIERNPNATRV